MAAPVPGFTIPAPDHCRKGRQCSKFNGHKGRYNSERSWNTFWRNSPVYNLNVRKRSLALEEERVGAVAEELAAKAARLDVRESELREGKLDMQKKLDDTDDGAPETSQLTMSLGSITFWNLGDRVRSRDYQYLLHCVSLSEKDQVLEDLWDQHTAEMALLEGNITTVCGKQCTAEFQPSADMSWQSWANNEVNQAATHPSPYANVSKTNMTTMGGSIGFGDGDTWEPYTNAVREKHVKLVQEFTSSLPATLSEKAKHENILTYLAENGLRQLGQPRIGIFAEMQKA
ncbi:uncharacterized protein LOC111341543 [Stylophora pistillata]|uniref:uncharacterized protein LOC111341543 n=1 Tax=Stylophora pistillata TaxID=50429 RepID=UPI000C05231B|nr:uncharacterized protein LOC111341543 [Stylophora pistillata]